MTRHVHGVYAPAGDAAYATPNGEIVHVPQDFAFADTVVALDEEIPTAPVSRPPPSLPPASIAPPSSRPPQSWGSQTRQHQLPYPALSHAGAEAMHGFMAPMAPPPAMRGPDAGLVTSVRGAFQRAKFTIDTSRGEMKELWSATEQTDPTMQQLEDDPVVRLARRIKTFWSFFEWDRADVMRAAWIGVAVFVIVATVGAFALQR